MNVLTIIMCCVAGCAFQELEAPVDTKMESRDILHKDMAGLGEAVEYKLDNSQSEDKVSWVVIVPDSIKVTTFIHDTVLIVDPPVDFRGKIRVMCRVVNFATEEIDDINVTTVFDNGSPAVRPDNDITIPVRPSKPDDGIYVTDDGLMIDKKTRAMSRQAAPQYSGEVYGAWNKAADQLRRDVALDVVNKNLVADLDASVESNDTEWREHFDIVFSEIEGKPASQAAKLYRGIAQGIKDKQK